MAVDGDRELARFSLSLAIAVHHTNEQFRITSRARERKMAVEVKGLADIVRRAKAAVSNASSEAAALQTSAQRLVATVDQVTGMRKELEDANAELQAAVGQMSNGGPPLDDNSPGLGASNLTLDQAASKVAEANAPK